MLVRIHDSFALQGNRKMAWEVEENMESKNNCFKMEAIAAYLFVERIAGGASFGGEKMGFCAQERDTERVFHTC